jgi:DNA-binding NarL/FixJ family response regulator
MNQAPCITVICNAEGLRHSLIALLHAHDFDVLEYSSVDHCIEKAISNIAEIASANLAVIDLNLALENELKALRDLRRKLPWLRKVLAIAPDASGQLGHKARAAGADYLVERPYMPSVLVDAVKQMAGPESGASLR